MKRTNQLHHARYYTWQPKAQRERRVRVTPVEFQSPAQFVKACEAVVPEWRPQRWIVMGNAEHVHFGIDYGRTAKGVSYHLTIDVSWAEALMLDAYLRVQHQPTTLWTIINIPEITNDDDGGESIEVLSASESLADMPVIGGVQ